MPPGRRIDPEAAAVIAARVLRGDAIREIARDTGLPYATVYDHAKQALGRIQQDETDYKAMVVEAFAANWRAFHAQMELAGDRDWLLDFPKERFPDLLTATATQGFKFVSVLDFEGDAEAEAAGGTGPDEGAGAPEPLDGEFVETVRQLPPGESV